VFENEPSVKLSYLVRQTSVGWRIVDVYLAGTVSELARRREEFGRIALLKRKSDELAIN
jgi:phospholipid transport system substrate-binding protein